MALERNQGPAAFDLAAFALRFDDDLPRVYAYVAARVDDRAAAEAITSTAFRRAMEVARGEAVEPDEVGGFAFSVAASALVDHVRRASREVPSVARAADFDRDTNDRRSAAAATDEVAARAFAAAIDRRALRRAIQRLPDAQRRLVVLRYLDGISADEQCAALGWSRETLARRVHAALRSLHGALADEASDAA